MRNALLLALLVLAAPAALAQCIEGPYNNCTPHRTTIWFYSDAAKTNQIGFYDSGCPDPATCTPVGYQHWGQSSNYYNVSCEYCAQGCDGCNASSIVRYDDESITVKPDAAPSAPGDAKDVPHPAVRLAIERMAREQS